MNKLKKHLTSVLDSHIAITKPITIKYFNQEYTVYPRVFNPILTASTTTTMRSIIRRKSLFRNKYIVDVGCGTGILGIQAIFLGATGGIGLDINSESIINAQKNVAKHNLQNQLSIISSDLFNNIDKKNTFDIFLANLPLVDQKPKNELEKSFYDYKLKTLERFLQEIKNWANTGSILFLNSASIMANPQIINIAKKNGLVLKEVDLFDEYIFDHYVLIFEYVY